jgi:hypothetical protein
MFPTTRNQRRALDKLNLQWPLTLREIPRETWPPQVDGHNSDFTNPRVRALRSRDFLVQAFALPDGQLRLSVCRTRLRADGRWDDGISWDDLQRLKAEAGYGDRYAVELYPADSDVVNVGNLRHLWLLDAPPAFAWRPKGGLIAIDEMAAPL